MMKNKTIAIGSDHAGFAYKQKLHAVIEGLGFSVKDLGPSSADSVDYPDFAHPVASAVESGEASLGILVCGSGNGVCMTANKHAGIRAAQCWIPELASLARQHNDANVLCLAERFVSWHLSEEIVTNFLTTEFEGGRHGRRVDKMPC